MQLECQRTTAAPGCSTKGPKESTQRKPPETHSKDFKSPLFPAISSPVFAVSKTLLACTVYLSFTTTSCLSSSKPEPRMFFAFISFFHIAHSEDNENVHSSHLPAPSIPQETPAEIRAVLSRALFTHTYLMKFRLSTRLRQDPSNSAIL